MQCAFFSTLTPLTLLLLALLPGCSTTSHSVENICKQSQVPCFFNVATVSLLTSKGNIELSVDGKNAPLTAGNFIDLVSRGIYDGTIFHRVIKSPVPFVVQGGDPLTSKPASSANAFGSGRFIDPKTGEVRYIPLEIKVKPTNTLVYGKEFAISDRSFKPVLVHDRGSLAMARSADPNSASSQFYIPLESLPELDGRYAVFGKVIKGMDVVDRLEQGDRLIRAVVVK